MIWEMDHEINPPKPGKMTKLLKKTEKEHQLHQLHSYELEESPQNEMSREKSYPWTPHTRPNPRAWQGENLSRDTDILLPPHPKNCLPRLPTQPAPKTYPIPYLSYHPSPTLPVRIGLEQQHNLA
jgi:hypothetical protein